MKPQGANEPIKYRMQQRQKYKLEANVLGSYIILAIQYKSADLEDEHKAIFKIM